MARKILSSQVPAQPIDRLVSPLVRFLHVEAASGVVLLVCTVVALALANSPLSDTFVGLWKTKVGFTWGGLEMEHSLKHWINDGLMAIFFFVVGLEVKREIVAGELRNPRQAALPVAAAIGGMVLPAGLYLLLQAGEPGARGWGIPMATDIAFVVGCLAVLGSRVPPYLRVLLLSLAIVDDIGAILVIAIGYTDDIDAVALGLAFAGLVLVLGLARAGVRSFAVYTGVGVLVWLAFHESGVHATLAGVILGLLTPNRARVSRGQLGEMLGAAGRIFRGDAETPAVAPGTDDVRLLQQAARETVSPLEYLEKTLHPWVGFVIMPLFALANAGVVLSPAGFGDPIALAVMAGLVIGKPVGILLAVALVVRLLVGELPGGLTWGTVIGAGFLAGIGFTMSLFIAGLALEGEALEAAKVGILGASALAAATGMGLLLRFPGHPGRAGRVQPFA